MIKLIFAANLAQIDEFRQRHTALSRNFNVSFHILCARPLHVRRPAPAGHVSPAFPKGNLSLSQRPPFIRQKATFRKPKGGLLHDAPHCAGKSLTANMLPLRRNLSARHTPETALYPGFRAAPDGKIEHIHLRSQPLSYRHYHLFYKYYHLFL